MEGVKVLILCIFAFTAVFGSHMQGGTISFTAKEKHLDGWTVDFKYKSAFIYGYGDYFYWGCFNGDCGYEIFHSRNEPVDNSTYPSDWYQYEGHIKRRVYNDKPFQLWESSCCWVWNNNYAGGWQLINSVDLGIRSDTGKPNSSPVTTTIPIIRIPRNCATTINLLAHDPDGDTVRCRYGYLYGECASCWGNFNIDEASCSILVPAQTTTGYYVQELILEDFPNNDIRLVYRDGTVSNKYRALNRRTRELPQTYSWYETSPFDTETEAVTVTAETSYSPETKQATGERYTGERQHTTETSYDTEPTELLLPIYNTQSQPTMSASANHVYTETTIIIRETTAEFHSTTDANDPYTTDTADTDVLHTAASTSITEKVSSTVTEAVTTTVEDSPTQNYFVTDIYTGISSPGPETEAYPYYTSNSAVNLDSLSKISLQFLVEVTSPAPSCIFGLYRPKFVTPTPNQGERLLTHVGKELQLHLSAEAINENITNFKVSGPSGISKSSVTSYGYHTWRMTVKWTPGKDDLGDHVPFCFVANTINGYQSEMRCVIVVVGPTKLVNSILTCHENTMTLIVPKLPYNELYENSFRLNDAKCLATSNSTHLIASVAYNTCGTEIEETEHDIVFKNQLTSFDNTSSVITRKHGVSIPFNCSFPKQTKLSSSFRARKLDYVFEEAGFGNFTYKFQFYTNDQFVALLTQYPVDVLLRDLLYMEIQVTSTVPSVQLFVESCRATPHDNPNDPVFYDIIQNGCEKDDTLTVYKGSRTQYRFSLEAFAFIGNYEEVYISCTVILCKMGDSATRCARGCQAGAGGNRRRRSLASETQQHFISQGPLRMKRGSPSTREDHSSLNMNTLVVALSGVVIVALVAVTVRTYMKKARSAGYERLTTQDC